MSRTRYWRAALIAAGTMALTAGTVGAQDKELVFGLQCDRTGATQTVGVFLCPGYHDYINLVNSKGGVEGFKIKVIEIDHEYKVPPAMEAHERFKKDGAILEGVYGTPQIAALTKKLEEDKILGTSPGFGNCGTRSLVITGPRLVRFDLSIVKRVQTWGSTNAEFRIEMLNAFNSPYFNPATTAGVPVGMTTALTNQGGAGIRQPIMNTVAGSSADSFRLTQLLGDNQSRIVQLVFRVRW